MAIWKFCQITRTLCDHAAYAGGKFICLEAEGENKIKECPEITTPATPKTGGELKEAR